MLIGTASLPHILMRFFTVNDARQARVSVLVTTGFDTVFYSLLFVLGFGAIVLLTGDPAYFDSAGNILGGRLRHHSRRRLRHDHGWRIGRGP